MKRFGVFLVLVMGVLLLSGCYWNEEVQTNQMGIQLNGNRVISVVGPGVYSDSAWYADLERIDVDTQTFSVEDPEVLTSDNQIVGVKVTIQARRKADTDSVRNLVTNWASLKNNDKFTETITATARESMKNGVRGFTLAGLLDDRNGLSTAITKSLVEDSAKYSAEIINVTIENVALNSAYANTLNEKAQLKVETEKALQEQDLIKQKGNNQVLQAEMDTKALNERLKKEQAQTQVDIEIASREGKVIAERNAVYEKNPQAFELAKLERYKEIFGSKSVFYFLPQGTDPTLIFNGSGLVPLEQK